MLHVLLALHSVQIVHRTLCDINKNWLKVCHWQQIICCPILIPYWILIRRSKQFSTSHYFSLRYHFEKSFPCNFFLLCNVDKAIINIILTLVFFSVMDGISISFSFGPVNSYRISFLLFLTFLLASLLLLSWHHDRYCTNFKKEK